MRHDPLEALKGPRTLLGLGVLLIALGLIGFASIGLPGCEKSEPESAATPPAAPENQTAAAETGASEAGDGTRTYSVKGRVAQMPTAESPLSEFMIHHEAIPDFVNAKGEASGMKEMTMPFPLGEGVSTEGLSVGDAVAFTFNVDWTTDDGTPAYYITKIEPLAEGETLNISE